MLHGCDERLCHGGENAGSAPDNCGDNMGDKPQGTNVQKVASYQNAVNISTSNTITYGAAFD